MKKVIFTYKDISTYRSELMGWAILWIMMLHFTFNQIKPLGFIAQYGYAGVDIFMMVSGFGLFLSLEKDDNISKFYRKRLLRIFPTYYFIGVFSCLFLNHTSLQDFIFRYSTIGFWTGELYADWYIPSIIALYFLTPFFKYLFHPKRFYFLIIIAGGTLIAAYYLINREDLLDRAHFFFLYRISAFIFGMTCAYWLKNNIPSKYFVTILLLGILIFVCLYPHHHDIYNYKYFSVLFLLPTFSLSLIYLSKTIQFLNPLIVCIGNASLEIYLIQGLVFEAILQGKIIIPSMWHDAFTILLIIISSLFGITTHWMIKKSGILHIS